jgi:putative ABC transport system ATP-binding protein
MVTHDAAAAAIADRILFLADGLIADQLTRSDPSEILAAMNRIS